MQQQRRWLRVVHLRRFVVLVGHLCRHRRSLGHWYRLVAISAMEHTGELEVVHCLLSFEAEAGCDSGR